MAQALLLEKLATHEWGIELDTLLSVHCQEPLLQGIEVVFLCNDGSGRSRTAAEALSKQNIPAIHIKGGLNQICSEEFDMCRGYLFTLLSEVPHIGVILTPPELSKYLKYLNQLRFAYYSSSSTAIESVSNRQAQRHA